MQAERPNILFIMSDQHRFDSLGCNGHPLVKTPNLDRLAQRGTNFTHAFTPLPMCVPVRSSLITGQWPSHHGAVHNFDGECFKGIEPSGPSVPRAITAGGYQSYHCGRWHVRPESTPLDFGFQEYTPDWRYAKWRKHQGIPPCPNTGGGFGNVDPHITGEQSSLAWQAQQVMDFLSKNEQQPDPFFVRWHMVEPHLPCRPPAEYAHLYAAKDMQPWPGFADSFKNKPYMQKQMVIGRETIDLNWEDWAPCVARYFAEITLMDAQIGRVLDRLEEMGVADNTLIIYTADHGDMCGSHKMIDKHCIMYDDVMRVPLIMAWPDHIAAGQVKDDFVVNAIDVPATWCAAAGIETPDYCDGLDLLSAATSERTDVFGTYHGNQFGNYSQRMLRDRRWKYVWNVSDLDELYDLEADPAELENRISDIACKDELQRLRLRMVDWMVETDDPLNNGGNRRILTEGLIYDGQ